MASEHGLQGYEFDDYSYFIIFYRRYGEFVPIVLLSLGVYVFVVMVIKLRNCEYVPKRHKWALVLYLGAMLGLLNIPDNYHTGIVKNKHTFFRAYPSAAAPIVEQVSKGHRLTIIGSRDHWRMAIWNNEIVYVKDSDLWMV
ncbi:hypothetical protein HNQ92_001321 [Rhabdobacter roseus]|uniref:SH3 domain-containing protein n=1 Tax=Rhabdobacter roseus TaxID=1655419 RepID=A0A840TJT6_9BACT|nr:hypothetical protein [Rhabdobacter roseus]MBB5283195.1 hypothetical protein [Rhabdobacter roseus]